MKSPEFLQWDPYLVTGGTRRVEFRECDQQEKGPYEKGVYTCVRVESHGSLEAYSERVTSDGTGGINFDVGVEGS